LQTARLERDIDLAIHLIINDSGYANPTGVAYAFQSRGDVYTVTENVVVIENNVTDVDAYAKFDTLIMWPVRIMLSHPTLDFNRTADRID
jgi:G3E family GTPase